jgi:hypothetical protein
MTKAVAEERWVRAIQKLIETKDPGWILNVDETSEELSPTCTTLQSDMTSNSTSLPQE